MSKWFPGRKLSWFRVTVLAVVIAALVGGSLFGWGWWKDQQEASTQQPWTDGYVDVTATPSFPFESPGTNGPKNVTLAFVVSDPEAKCEPAWGGVYSLDKAESMLDLDRRLARLRNLGGSAMVSFGGQANSDLALACTDHTKIVDGYTSVVERYELKSIDMDIEGEMLGDHAAVARQAKAIKAVQDATKGDLDVWLTLPVAPTGLTEDGISAVKEYLNADVDLAGINSMTMDYNAGLDEPYIKTITGSLEAVHAQLRTIGQEVGKPIGDATAWRRMGATPMIGQNDVRDEVFTIADAKKLSTFANEKGLGRISMWSLNRDKTCDANWPDPQKVSDSCSGIDQGDAFFFNTLAGERSGSISQLPKDDKDATDKADPTEKPDATNGDDEIDDPETSPYPVWNKSAAYPAETKVVWHRNVYEAKWWTEGDQPDLPTEAGAHPWRLIGPVLPGEKPVERPQIPEGFYAKWQAGTEYRQGERVIFDGQGFEARWWTKGESPDAALVMPQNSPWRVLNDREILEIKAEVEPGKN